MREQYSSPFSQAAVIRFLLDIEVARSHKRIFVLGVGQPARMHASSGDGGEAEAWASFTSRVTKRSLCR